MADGQQSEYGPIQPEMDDLRGVFKKANDWLHKIPTMGQKQSPHDAAIEQMNKQANDQRVADANKTYATQTMAQKKTTPAPTPGKTMTKTSPRKR